MRELQPLLADWPEEAATGNGAASSYLVTAERREHDLSILPSGLPLYEMGDRAPTSGPGLLAPVTSPLGKLFQVMSLTTSRNFFKIKGYLEV